jgi:putative SOS response-associated peptidase YedK
MAMAGLWENWKSPASEWVRSFTIITTIPNELCAEIHNRMPVILPEAAWSAWLGEQAAGDDALKMLLTPYPAEDMTMWPISTRVGNVKNNDPRRSRRRDLCLFVCRQQLNGAVELSRAERRPEITRRSG